MTKVLVATTMAAYKALPDRPVEESQAWLTHAERWASGTPQVEFFAALQTGQGHDRALKPLIDRLAALGGESWRFSFDDGAEQITSGSRLAAICTGRNLCHERVNRDQSITHLLLLDSDVEPPADALTKLLEVRWPIVAGHIPTYCLPDVRLRYEPVDGGWWKLEGSQHLGHWERPVRRPLFPPEAVVSEHWASAGCWMLTRTAVNRVRWGWSLDEGQTDDPWTADLARRVGLGPMWTRRDVVCTHHPDAIGRLEDRGHDLSVNREPADA